MVLDTSTKQLPTVFNRPPSLHTAVAFRQKKMIAKINYDWGLLNLFLLMIFSLKMDVDMPILASSVSFNNHGYANYPT